MMAAQYGIKHQPKTGSGVPALKAKVNYDNVPLSELADEKKFSHRAVDFRGNEVTVEFTSIATRVSTTRTLPANRLPSEYAKEAEAHKAEAAARKARAQQEALETAHAREHMRKMANQMFGPLTSTTDKANSVEADKARAARKKRQADNRAKRIAAQPKKGAGGSKDLHGSSSKKKSGGKK